MYPVVSHHLSLVAHVPLFQNQERRIPLLIGMSIKALHHFQHPKFTKNFWPRVLLRMTSKFLMRSVYFDTSTLRHGIVTFLGQCWKTRSDLSSSLAPYPLFTFSKHLLIKFWRFSPRRRRVRLTFTQILTPKNINKDRISFRRKEIILLSEYRREIKSLNVSFLVKGELL